MEHPVSRVIVSRISSEKAELVPYLVNLIDSLERHGGFYHTKLAEVLPVDVIKELDQWLRIYSGNAVLDQRAQAAESPGLNVDLELLEHIFTEYADEFAPVAG